MAGSTTSQLSTTSNTAKMCWHTGNGLTWRHGDMAKYRDTALYGGVTRSRPRLSWCRAICSPKRVHEQNQSYKST